MAIVLAMETTLFLTLMSMDVNGPYGLFWISSHKRFHNREYALSPKSLE